MMPLVSCIVAVYNTEKYLRAALESILAQTGAALEVIVVDDGSTDDTVEVARSFGDRVRLLCLPHGGTATARNAGLRVASGDFIAILDGDDLVRPDKLELQLAEFQRRPDLELCAGYVQNFRGDMELVGEPITGYNMEMLYRRELFDRFGLLKPELEHGAKLDWMLRAREAGMVEYFLPETLVYRRLHETNVSRIRGREQSEAPPAGPARAHQANVSGFRRSCCSTQAGVARRLPLAKPDARSGATAVPAPGFT